MPTFTSFDGTEVVCNVLGEPAEPLVCLPGGPLRASRYLGNLGGMDADLELVLVELPPRRVDRIVDDLEFLRTHIGRDRLDILAHSAACNLALLYAAAHPDRVDRLLLVTPGMRVIGIETPETEMRAAIERRAGEPWYAEALAALEAWEAGDDSPAVRLAAAPFFYGRWDEAAQAHAAGEAAEATSNAYATYYGEETPDWTATRSALGDVTAETLILIGEKDIQPTLSPASELAEMMPNATVAVQPGAGHYPWMDDPPTFTRTLTGFLTR